jgi:hypothetical protein
MPLSAASRQRSHPSSLSTSVRAPPSHLSPRLPQYSSTCICTGVLLYVTRHGYTPAEQSRAAFVLRRDIRKAHVDVRFNARVAADCWRIIDAIENSELDIDVNTSSAGKPMSNGKRKSLDPHMSPTLPSSQRGKKRAR